MQEHEDRVERLREQVWRHLEAGKWDMAMAAAEILSDFEPGARSEALAESARILSEISDAVFVHESVDQSALVRLERIARAWPRLAKAPPFQALVEDVRKVVPRNRTTSSASPGAATAPAPMQAKPAAARSESRPSRCMIDPRGWAGILATIACALVVLLVFNSVAYYYLREQPTSVRGPEANTGARATLAPWHGLMDLEGPVDTIILGDSSAYWNLVTGPIADRMGGTCINLGNNVGSSLLMDSWMLQYYVNKFGPPRNVVLLRTCQAYETGHNLEFMSLVPLEWGYWDRLGPAPDWGNGEMRRLFLSKYGVLDSGSDVLSDRLMHPLDLLAQPYQKVGPDPYYYRGVPLDLASTLENFRRENSPRSTLRSSRRLTASMP